MKIYKTKEELLEITATNTLNWGCVIDGCWFGPCFVRYDKAPKGCPAGTRIPKWKIIR